jgi:hypothetical protein
MIRAAFSVMQNLHEKGRFPVMSFSEVASVLPCALFLGFHSFLDEYAPLIAENLTSVDPTVIAQFPPVFRERCISLIPICRLDPDFVIETLGFDLLAARFARMPMPAMHDAPFTTFSHQEASMPVQRIANSLLHFDLRFATSEFVQRNCTQVFTSEFVNLSGFVNLHELSIGRTDLQDRSLKPMLPASLKRLEIAKIKLQNEQLQEVIELMRRGTLFCVCLREAKLGPKGCELLTSFLLGGQIGELKYLDISSNGIGAAAIDRFLAAASKTTLAGVAVDANFFEPCADALKWFANTLHSAVSVKGLHWDRDSTTVMASALKNRSVKYWDLGAQVVHQHSDPDLSSEVTELMFTQCSPDIECILFTNHTLNGLSLDCISHVSLKALSLANSSIEDDTMDTLIPLLDRLVWLDVSYNSIIFRNPAFLVAAAGSPTLKVLILSHNDIGDGNGRALFEAMERNGSRLTTVRLRNCFLRKHSASALLSLLASGLCSFDELDLGGNEVFHMPLLEFDPGKRTRVEYLYVGGNGSKTSALGQLFSAVTDLKFLDLDRTPSSVVMACGPHVSGVLGLSICFTGILSDSDIITLIQGTRTHELWLVHSISQKTLEGILERYREIPLCLAIHIGDDLECPRNSPIPIIVEQRTA